MRAPVGLLVLPCGLLVSAVIEIRVSPPRHGRLCSLEKNGTRTSEFSSLSSAAVEKPHI